MGRSFIRVCSLLGLLLLLASCTIVRTGCCTFRFKCNSCLCCSGRRPPVMRHCYPYVIDYDPCGAAHRARLQRPTTRIAREYLQPFMQEDGPYRLQIGDFIEISVFALDGNTVFSTQVAPDGRVYYMHLTDIIAAGRTEEEIAADITRGLEDLLAGPIVSVNVVQRSSDYYMVMGRVFQPGLYPLAGQVTLRDAITDAGGPLEIGDPGDPVRLANFAKSFVRRKNGENFFVDFEGLLYEGRNDQNIYIRPGDYVYLAPVLNEEIYLLGAVGGGVIPYQDSLTLVSILAPLYGPYINDPYLTPDWRNVLVIRGSLCNPCVVYVDFQRIIRGEARDFCLLPGDFIFVPNQTMRFARSLVNLALDAFITRFVRNAAEHYADEVLGGDFVE